MCLHNGIGKRTQTIGIIFHGYLALCPFFAIFLTVEKLFCKTKDMVSMFIIILLRIRSQKILNLMSNITYQYPSLPYLLKNFKIQKTIKNKIR